MSIRLNDAANGAGGAATVPGQVAEFAAGAVPADGWRQIDGPVTPPAEPGIFVARNTLARKNYPFSSVRRHYVEAAGRLFAFHGSATVLFHLHECDAELQPTGPVVAHTNTFYTAGSPYRMCGLADGNLLRIGGRPNSTSTVSAVVQRLNTASGALTATALASAPVATDGGYSAYAQAQDGKVYFAASSNMYVFDYANNIWEPESYPVGHTVSAMVPIPGENALLLIGAGAVQYFDCVTREAVVLTDNQSSYAFGAAVQGGQIVWLTEASDASSTFAVLNSYDVATREVISAPLAHLRMEGPPGCVKNPYSGEVLFYDMTDGKGRAYGYHADYTPRGVVRAVKT